MDSYNTVDIRHIAIRYSKIYRTSIFYRTNQDNELYGDIELREDQDND